MRTRAEAVACLEGLGFTPELIDSLPDLVLVAMADQQGQLDELRAENDQLASDLRRSQHDVIRLRGQRDALRTVLREQQNDDPMMGYLSQPMLPTADS